MGYMKETLWNVIGDDTHETKQNLWHVDHNLSFVFSRLVSMGRRLETTRKAMLDAIETDEHETSVVLIARRYDVASERFDEAELIFRTLWLYTPLPTELVDDAIRQARTTKGVRTDRQTLDAIADALSVETWSPTTLDEIALLVSNTGRTFNPSTNEEGETK